MQQRRIVNSLRNAKVHVALLRRLPKSPKSIASMVVVAGVFGTGVAVAATQTITTSTPDGSIQTTVTTTAPEEVPVTTVESSVKGAATNVSSSASANGAQTTVTVNGQTVTVPANSSYNKTVNTDGGTTTVNVENKNNGGNSFNSSTTTVNSFSSSTNFSQGTHTSTP